MENNMDKVWKALNLDIFEKFNMIPDSPYVLNRKIMEKKLKNPYYFTDEGLINRYGVLDNERLPDLIVGIIKIEKYRR